jgi:hypothetical protein
MALERGFEGEGDLSGDDIVCGGCSRIGHRDCLGNRTASTDAAEDHPPPSRKELDMKLIIGNVNRLSVLVSTSFSFSVCNNAWQSNC